MKGEKEDGNVGFQEWDKKNRRLEICNFEDLEKKKNNAWNSLPKVAFDSSKTNVEITFLGPSVEVNSVKNDVQLWR